MYCETLLCIEGVWFFNDTFGLTINLLQIKLDIPILIEEYSFSNKTQNDTNIYRDDPAYKTYFKMLKMGIPILVVKQKMTLVGLNPDILDGKDCPNVVPYKYLHHQLDYLNQTRFDAYTQFLSIHKQLAH